MKNVSSILACWVVCVACSGPSFQAVDTTGKLGQQIDGSGVFDAAVEICILTQAMTPGGAGGTGADPCASVAKDTERWTSVAEGLSAYSSKLSELATAEDVNPSDQIGSVFGAATAMKLSPLAADQNEPLAGFAGQLIRVLSMSYRKGVLDEVIRDTNPGIQKVKETLEGEVKLRLEGIRGLSMTLGQLSTALAVTPQEKPLPAPVDPPWAKQLVEALERRQENQFNKDKVLNQNANVPLQLARHELTARAAAYRDLQTNVVAFAAAHDELAKNLGKLDAKELGVQVIEVAKSAVKAATSLKKSEAATDGS